MKIITLNTWKCDGDYRRRLSLMARGLAALDADVVCLQECFRSAAAGVDTAATLAAATGLSLVRRDARRKVRSFEGADVDSTSGLAILLRARPTAWSTTPLPSDPRDGERLAIHADLQLGDRRMRIVCTHLTHLDDAALRARQAQGLLALDDGGADAVIMAGDFNAALAAPELRVLRERCRGGAQAAVGETTFIGTRAATGLAPEPAGRPAIDHLLLLDGACAGALSRPHTVLDRPAADGVYPSDHKGVLGCWAPEPADARQEQAPR